MIRASMIVFLLPALLCAAEASAAATTTTAYVNGSWFDGSGFVSRYAYVIGDTLSFHRPRRIDAIVDLEGGYVVPPFGEAHNHNVEPLNNLPKVIATYLERHLLREEPEQSAARSQNRCATGESAGLHRYHFCERRLDQYGGTSDGDRQAPPRPEALDRAGRRRWLLLDRRHSRSGGAKLGSVPRAETPIRQNISSLFPGWPSPDRTRKVLRLERSHPRGTPRDRPARAPGETESLGSYRDGPGLP